MSLFIHTFSIFWFECKKGNGRFLSLIILLFCISNSPLNAQQLSKVEPVEWQPFAAQVKRIIETMEYVGAPLSAPDVQAIEKAFQTTNFNQATLQIQNILDSYCLLGVNINPESRVKVLLGPAKPELQQNGWRSFLIKVHNEAGVTAPLKVQSQNAQPVYARGKHPTIPGGFSLDPLPQQLITPYDLANRWLDLSLYDKPPLQANLFGLNLEYRIIQLYSRDAGKREAKIGFDVGQGTQDIGFRNEMDILFTCLPAQEINLEVLDENNKSTTASFIIRDQQKRLYPAPAKRLAPDFSFHPQIYRSSGEKISLPSGTFTIDFTRGPEYLPQQKVINVVPGSTQTISFKLKRWIDPAQNGWYSGDHHIHAAGCSHYEAPTQGVLPQDMIRHVLGEALNVGSVLTWGPGYYYQKQFFEAKENKLSTGKNILRYDLEISGFPSSHTGHLALLRLKEQDFPGTKNLEDWPSYSLPVLQWAKKQGAVVGFAHSGWGLEVKSDQLPNYEIPPFNGIGANEYIVDVTHNAVDFISAVDTPAPWELNIWYHTLNCGFKTRISGETDFPCIYGERVGLGRSYVKLKGKLTYDDWVQGLAEGRSYVSDGKSHLMDFKVNSLLLGTKNNEIALKQPGTVKVQVQVAAHLNTEVNTTIRTKRYDQQPYWDLERARLGTTRQVPVEVIVNGLPAASKTVLADGTQQDLSFSIPIQKSSWVAVRILPSSHTNPIFIEVAGKPIRASRASAEWCLQGVEQCWKQKSPLITAKDRSAAEQAFNHARQIYRQIIAESEAK